MSTRAEVLADAYAIYNGSDGEATKALYGELGEYGALGRIAINLFRAHKKSARAKLYRGGVRGKGSYRRMSYETKNWAIDNLCEELTASAAVLGIRWGWAEDPGMARIDPHRWVLYVDNEPGQVSFHHAGRGSGPDYPGEWDGVVGAGVERICSLVAAILTEGQEHAENHQRSREAASGNIG